MPAAEEFSPLAAVWVPGADLRPPRALPVLVIAGRDEENLRAEIASLADGLGAAEIPVTQEAPAAMDAFEARTVALLNRGVPGFAVDLEGTLHSALLRSCTGWPSGTWIDDPRRTAPDGSNFQLQHWTHDFDYAFVSGAGDWRGAGIPARSAAYSQPLLAVAPGPGTVAPSGSLLHVEPADAVRLGAFKAAGNPLAAGSARPIDPAAVALRLVETTGAGTRVTVGSTLGNVGELRLADLLERPLPEKGPAGRDVDLHGHQVATVLTRLEMPRASVDSVELAPDTEAAQPLYARYWLHNRGPAPIGGMPAVAHLHPAFLDADPGGEVGLRLTVASDCSDAILDGIVSIVCPEGWSATPAELPFTLPGGDHREAEVVVSIPAGARSGPYPVRAQLGVTGAVTGDAGGADLPAAWRQVVEDVCVVSVGGDGGDGGDPGELLYLIDGPAQVALAAGETATLSVTVGTIAGADLAAEAHLISPWGTWEWIGPAAQGAVLPARGTAEFTFEVSPPAWQDPGQWWALVRIACAGRLVYSPAVRVTVI